MGLPNGRAIIGGLLMALAALGAFALAGSGDDADTVEVVVADRDLRAGDLLEASDLRLVAVDIDGEVSGLFGSRDALVGRVMLSPVDAGEFVVSSATTEAVDGISDAYEMSVSLGPERVPGALAAGESVHVFATWSSGITELIAVDAVVVAIGEVEGGLVDGGDLHLRLQLSDVGQVEAVVHAHSSGALTLVRAPVEGELTVGRQFEPGDSDTGEGQDSSG